MKVNVTYSNGAWRSNDLSLTYLKWLPDGYGTYTDDPFRAIAFRKFFDESAVSALNSGVSGCWDIENQLNRSYATDTDFQPVYTPEGEQWLDYQRAGIEFAISPRLTHALIGDEPGLGKTNQAIGVANEYIARYEKFRHVLIICPAAVRVQWAVMIRDWGLDGDAQQILTNGNQAFNLDARWWITSYSLAASGLNKDLENLTKQKAIHLAVFDEIHYMKETTTKRYTRLVGKRHGVLRDVPKIVGLSGTPSVNRPRELYSLFSLMNINVLPLEARSKKGFNKLYCPSELRSKTIKDKTVVFEHHLLSELIEEVQRRLRMFMVRREKKDVLLNLPSKTIRPFYLTETAESRKVVAKINDLLDLDVGVFEKIKGKKEAVAEYGKKLLAEIRKKQMEKGEEGEKMWATLRKELGVAKATPVLDFLKVILSEEDKVVAIVYHREVGDILFEGLTKGGYHPVMVRGGVSNKKREKYTQAFLTDDKTRVFIGQMTVAAVGLNLQRARRLVIVEPSTVSGLNDQAMDRIHRIGQTRDVFIEMPLFEKSLDEIILLTELAKRAVLDRTHNKKHILCG